MMITKFSSFVIFPFLVVNVCENLRFGKVVHFIRFFFCFSQRFHLFRIIFQLVGFYLVNG